MIQSNNRKPHEMRRYSAPRRSKALGALSLLLHRALSAKAFNAEIGAFVEAVAGGTAQPEVGFEDGRRALMLAEAAYVSCRERRLVSVSEIA